MNKAAQALGRLGGSKTSEAKAAAARKNAKRPRPNARKKARELKRAAEADAPCSACPKGSRSGLSFDQLHALARTDRMEWGMVEPLYFHAAKCGRKCDGTCNGLDGLHIAQDADDVITGGWKDDGGTWCMSCRHRRPSGPDAMLCDRCRREAVKEMVREKQNEPVSDGADKI